MGSALPKGDAPSPATDARATGVEKDTASPNTFAAITPERIRWIETWAKGWRHFLALRFPSSKGHYHEMPLDVAVAMIEELTTALRNPEWALRLLADELHESGQEIGEAVEARRNG